MIHQLQAINDSIDTLKAYIARSLHERFDAREALRGLSLNHRQVAVIESALKHPHREHTAKSQMLSHRVVYQTAHTDLMGLEKLGLLVSQKIGREILWLPVADLREAIARAK